MEMRMIKSLPEQLQSLRAAVSAKASDPLFNEAVPVPTDADSKACTMDDMSMNNAKQRAYNDTVAPVKPVSTGIRKQLHIIAGEPATFKSATVDTIKAKLAPDGVVNADFDDFRDYVTGTAEYSQRFPMSADTVAAGADQIRASILAACMERDSHTFYPGAFKTPSSMLKILKQFSEAGFEGADSSSGANTPGWHHLFAGHSG